MSNRVDARGLSCPQPVVLTRSKIKEMVKGTFEVLVDTGTSRDNISRLASHEGWSVSVKEEGDGFLLTLQK